MLLRRLCRATPNEQNRALLRHIIGIEQWGQRRLNTLLGASLLDAEYDDYRPDAALDWLALRQELARTRRRTIALGHQIAARGIGDAATIPHNDAGTLDTREWLYYLNVHSRAEEIKVH